MKRAVMYGAGNIGRGFVGQLFSESGYEVAFIDVNTDIIAKLNEDRKYPVVILAGAASSEITITNVRGVNGMDMEAVSMEIANADIMAIAVGVEVLPRIAKPIAQGLIARWRLGNFRPLNIIICENLLNADKYLADLIKGGLDEEQKLKFDELIGLVEASIGRMVPVMTSQMQDGNILRICVEEYGELPVDRAAFKGEIPSIKNMRPFSPFDFYIQRKLYIHNMGHALTAYLGRLKGYNYIWEAIMDPSIKYAVYKAMQDSAVALSKEHGFELDTILNHVDDLIYRFGNKQLGDTVSRVGNDTGRKLAPSDRLIGAANLCISHGINPSYMCLGIAAAMKFDTEQDLNLKGACFIALAEGPEAVLKKLCGLSPQSLLWNNILEFYKFLTDKIPINEIIDMTVEIKRRKVE